jgi:hypothetical protein
MFGKKLCVVQILASETFVSISINFQGHVVAYLVEALCYKPEGRGFDAP